jgi:enoyl-CoA hydratase
MGVVSHEVDGRVLVATMQSPPANALSLDLVGGLEDTCDAVLAHGARAVVLCSAVEGFFVAGADLKLLGSADRASFGAYLARVRAVFERLTALPAVSIAAIDGHALGGGLELAMACTLRVAGPRARLGVPEIKLGLFPGAAGTQLLPRLVGRGPALDLLLTGRSTDGEEGHRLGLVDRFDPEGAKPSAQALAHEIAQFPSSAIAAIGRCVRAAQDQPLTEGVRVENEEILALFEGEDAREGVTAFLEKRPARFA